MAEKQTHNPEASKQTIADLYQQAANYLETAIYKGTAKTEPGMNIHGGILKVTTDVPELNGRRLSLDYERPSTNEDPTQVDREIPLAWTDETGKNHWWTPIGIKVYNRDGGLVHDYDVMTTEDPNTALVYDKRGDHDPDTGDLPTITSLDASEIMAHLEWAFEQQSQQ